MNDLTKQTWPVSTRARDLHEAALVWDSHSCLPLKAGIDISDLERHRASGIDYVSVNVGMDFNPLSQVIRVLATFRGWLATRPDHFMIASTAADVRRAKAEGKLAVSFDLEGSDMIEGDLDMLRLYRDLGVRQMHLAYNRDNPIAGGCHGADIGLTALGHKVVAEINRLGIIMDCSHSGYRTSMDVMAASTKPVVFSHTCMRKLMDHPRNVWDDQIDACARTGGVIGITGIGIFLGADDASTATFMRHVDYAVQRVGAAHVGIGLDFVFRRGADDYPPNFDRSLWWPPSHRYVGRSNFVEPERMPLITEALIAQGYSDADIRGILGENFLRIAQQTWPAEAA
ncbi:MAG: membrane dipeptidase [Alphaproteobacteria bacterium]|nr:membrane dipeptidase [Alphaproteobacteria bacterium]